MVVKERDFASLFINLFVTTCAMNCALIIMTLNLTENEISKNIILNVIYRQPNGDVKASKDYFNHLFPKNDKKVILVPDFSINVLDFENNKIVAHFFSQHDSNNK